MTTIALIASAICLLKLPPSGEARCKPPFLATSRVLETRGPNDGPIMNIDTQTSETRIVSRIGKHDLASFFNISDVGHNRSNVYLTKPLNMDFIRDVPRSPSGDLTIVIRLECICKICDPNSVKTMTYSMPLIISPVDNYPPEFRPNIVLNVSETIPVGGFVANIRARVVDRDFPDFTNITHFAMHPYPASKEDGYGTFRISDHGDISLSKPLDYDEGNRTYKLRVSATNNLNETANGVITVNVINANDNPPKFVFPGCDIQCEMTHYELNQDSLSSYDLIQAKDLDNDTISYSISKVSPGTWFQYVNINNETGKLSMTKSADGLMVVIVLIQAISTPAVPDASDLYGTFNRALAIVMIYPPTKPASSYRSCSGIQRLPNWPCWFACLLIIRATAGRWCELKT